jgi:hypothetical protein
MDPLDGINSECRKRVRNYHRMPKDMRVLAPDFTPTEDTVVLGRTCGDDPLAEWKQHPGNRRLLIMVMMRIKEYAGMPTKSINESDAEQAAIVRKHKAHFITLVVREVNLRNPVAGFVRLVDDEWWEVSEMEACRKVKDLFAFFYERRCHKQARDKTGQSLTIQEQWHRLIAPKHVERVAQDVRSQGTPIYDRTADELPSSNPGTNTSYTEGVGTTNDKEGQGKAYDASEKKESQSTNKRNHDCREEDTQIIGSVGNEFVVARNEQDINGMAGTTNDTTDGDDGDDDVSYSDDEGFIVI